MSESDTDVDTSLYAGLQKLSGARFVECNNAGDVIDADILRSVKDGEQNIALPSAGNTDRDKFHGAIVFDPQPGRHRNVFYLDFASLYPNAMRDMNASPDTLIGRQRELIASEYSRRTARWGWVDPRPVKQLDPHEVYSNFTGGEYKMVYDPDKNSIKWRDDWGRIQDNLQRVYFEPPSSAGGTDGFLPERADTYITWNKSYSGTMYSATKRQRNALYGVSGDNNFRLFDWRVAESITIFGRRLLEVTGRQVIDRLASQFDRDNLYITHGDTDGIGIAIDTEVDNSIEQLLPIVEDTVAWLEDNYLDDYLERTFGIPTGSHHQAIDIETFSPTLFIPEDDDGTGIKKTYAERVTYDEGDSVDELDVTGFELVRSDIADVTEVVQSDVLEAICYAEPEEARRTVYERVRKAMTAITERQTPLEDIVVWQGLSKDPSEYGTVDRRPQPAYRGAKYANQFIDGESISAGDSVAQVYVARIEPTSDLPSTYVSETAEGGDTVDTIAVSDPSNVPSSVVIDREKHARKTVIEPLESVFRALGWDFDAARVGQTQQSLTEF